MHHQLLVVLLIIGIVAGVVLVKNETTTKTRATSNLVNSFEFRDANGNKIECTPNKDGIPVCITPTLEITATLKTDPLPNN